MKYLYDWIEYSKSIAKLPQIKRDEDLEDLKINVIDKSVSNHNGTANRIKLPMEIWENIAHIGKINYSMMIIINKSFFCTFAPKIYDTLRLTIVLSPLTKMKLNDEAFLKNGPDTIKNKYYDSYSIYERHQESASFDYEFLDTSINDQDYFKGIDPAKHEYFRHDHPLILRSELRGERFNKPFEVRSLKNIQFILKNILQNPNSIMKKFIKEILIDICVFDGFDKLMTMKHSSLITGSTNGHESIKELIDQVLEQNELVSVLKISADQNQVKPFHAAPLDDNFDRIRWKDSLEDKTTRFFKIYNNIKTKLAHESIKHDLYSIFPQNVYYKELLSVYLLSGKLYSDRLRRRLSEFEYIEEFEAANPIKHWYHTITTNFYNRKKRQLDLGSYFRMIVTGQSCVKITNREFKTKQQVYDILNDLFTNVTCIKTTQNDDSDQIYKSSILILGLDDGEPQLPKEFTDNASIPNDDVTDLTLLDLYPKLILINKL
ncbi:hypothetical protein BN7_3439 [Wickerhamomyces ciferrii]|uniref:Uncharacterized protein n=1 Tax=Wickerhamomyces ciferrii (strain ATCC 14091 / BCRC 22168 / CBS 111 / JCM 3599 / NBRC 0793 / NRRL Y-1031 F-60-10) TaxID=1206466 RepID=K0KFI2_WICCF|nr:uncharacterized protein BN7_3439 [Wickerhamomyces ciferrii]CCH43885.1 hypothetical protein BN7_3439 [Wickerhamomyces ciferrii]